MNHGIDRNALHLPAKYIPHIRSGSLVNYISGFIFIPHIPVRRVTALKGSVLLLRQERRGNLTGNISGIQGVNQILQRHREGPMELPQVKLSKVFFDRDEACSQCRKNLFQIVAHFNVISPESAQITNHDSFQVMDCMEYNFPSRFSLKEWGEQFFSFRCFPQT